MYTEPHSLGLDPLIHSWMDVLPTCFKPAMRSNLLFLFDVFLQPSISFLRRNLQEPVPTVDNQLCRSLLNILDCFFEPFMTKEARDPPTPEAIQDLATDIPALFIFALTWSVAGTTNRYGPLSTLCSESCRVFRTASLVSGAIAVSCDWTERIKRHLYSLLQSGSQEVRRVHSC